jgi:hypothetical protein
MCSLRKILLVCAFYKLEYLSCLDVVLPNFWKKKSLFTLLYLVLDLIKLVY